MSSSPGPGSEPQVTEAGGGRGKAHPIRPVPSGWGAAIEFLLERSGVMNSSSPDSRYSQSPLTGTPQHFRLGGIQMGVRLKFIFAVFAQKDLKKLVNSVNKNNYNIQEVKV